MLSAAVSSSICTEGSSQTVPVISVSMGLMSSSPIRIFSSPHPSSSVQSESGVVAVGEVVKLLDRNGGGAGQSKLANDHDVEHVPIAGDKWTPGRHAVFFPMQNPHPMSCVQSRQEWEACSQVCAIFLMMDGMMGWCWG